MAPVGNFQVLLITILNTRISGIYLLLFLERSGHCRQNVLLDPIARSNSIDFCTCSMAAETTFLFTHNFRFILSANSFLQVGKGETAILWKFIINDAMESLKISYNSTPGQNYKLFYIFSACIHLGIYVSSFEDT